MEGAYCKYKEGYVIRNVNSFHILNQNDNVAKYVSTKFKEEFNEDSHWRTQAVKWNKIKGI